MTMNQRRLNFVHGYVEHGIATKAYIDAGYSENGAAQGAERLLRNVEVQSEIAALRANIAERNDITQDRIVQEYARIAFTNLPDVSRWDEHGMALTPSSELTEAAAAAIKEVRVTRTITRGKDDYEQERIEEKITMHDKKGALDSLGKHLGMFVERHDVRVLHAEIQAAASELGVDADELMQETQRLLGGK